MTFFPFFDFNAFKCERVYMCVCMCVYKVFEKCWQNEDSWVIAKNFPSLKTFLINECVNKKYWLIVEPRR